MGGRKLVVGRRMIERKYTDERGKEQVAQEWENFSDYAPLSAEDLRQRDVDDAEYRARLDAPREKPIEDIVKELQNRIAALETQGRT
ncbi:MAG: hypothetical protein ACKVP3_23680 [Hyphomicrobiaceae bacterium]